MSRWHALTSTSAPHLPWKLTSTPPPPQSSSPLLVLVLNIHCYVVSSLQDTKNKKCKHAAAASTALSSSSPILSSMSMDTDTDIACMQHVTLYFISHPLFGPSLQCHAGIRLHCTDACGRCQTCGIRPVASHDCTTPRVAQHVNCGVNARHHFAALSSFF